MDPEFIGYTTAAELGLGAYGDTFLAHDEEEIPYAIKWMKPDAPDAPARFKNEVWALRELRHHSIPVFKDQGELEGRPYIVMSYAEGLTVELLTKANRALGVFESPLKVLLVVKSLMLCLDYLRLQKVVHQDIKADNVIVSAAAMQITLIDFGLCSGPHVPEKLPLVVNVGAPAYSPPSKLRHPAKPRHKHDVFAVGVLAYLMLTNRLPWEIHAGTDHSSIATAMEREELSPLRSHNPHVSAEVAAFVEGLLKTSDADRLTAKLALGEVSRLISMEEKNRVAGNGDSTQSARFTRVIRDPLHGDIWLTEFERAIVNTPEFQRLRRLRQLGTSYLVYYGAEHTRFSHAIGTMHIAEKILRAIEQRKGRPFEQYERNVARSFALLHDVSHAPFGHTLEDELRVFHRHDSNRDRLKRIFSDDSPLNLLLSSTGEGRDVLELLFQKEKSPRYNWINELISGPTGADVIDYIDRDALFCGLDHRVDSAIYRWFAIDTPPGGEAEPAGRHVFAEHFGRHGTRIDADFAALALLRERHALFMKVYNHRTKIAAGAMLGRALWSAMGSRPDVVNEQAVERLGDEELLGLLDTCGDSYSREIVGMLKTRTLYKPVYTAPVLRASRRHL
jgi:HD superfamily phosphohydrolase